MPKASVMSVQPRTAMLVAMIVAISFMFASGCAAAQSEQSISGATRDYTAPSGFEQPATLTVNGNGIATANPDVADISLSVATTDGNPTIAIDDNTAAMTAVMDTLRTIGIANTDIKTVSFNMWVEQVFGRDGPTGEIRYHVSNQISVRVRDINTTGDVLGAALAAGANSVGGVVFGVEDAKMLEDAARDAAIDNAVEKGKRLASRLGVTLGSLREVREVSGALPAPIAERALTLGRASSSVPITPGDFKAAASVTIVFDLE